MKSKTLTVFSILFLGIAIGPLSAQTIWWSGTIDNEIWHASADGSGTPTVLYSPASDGARGPTGIDLNPLSGEIYWGTGNNSDFWSGNANGSGAGFFVDPTTAFDEALGAAVDPASNRVYLINESLGLYSVNTDGTGIVNLSFQPGGTTGVEWDAANNRVLVSQLGGFGPQISEVAPDGSSSGTLIDNTPGVRDLATNGDSIFWVDNTAVYSANSDGTNVQTLAFDIDGGNVRTVDYFDGSLYLGEFGGINGDSIWRFDLASGASNVLYQGNFGSIRGLTVGVVVPEPTGMAVLALIGCATLIRRRSRS